MAQTDEPFENFVLVLHAQFPGRAEILNIVQFLAFERIPIEDMRFQMDRFYDGRA